MSGKELQTWADANMFEATPMKKIDGKVIPHAYLLWATPDPLGAVAAMYRMYEGTPTYDLEHITDEERRYYWGEAKKSHLGAPLESIKLHFFIEGIDRAITHQMVRQRTAVFAQESLRFAVKEGLASEVPLPANIMEGSDEADVWTKTIEGIEESYMTLVNAGIPAEEARGLLPHATPTRLNWITDFSNLVYHAGNRLCTQAQFPWRLLLSSVVHCLGEYNPQWPSPARTAWQWQMISKDDLFRPVCFRLGHCPWGEEMARPCTIRDRVDEGKFDEIKIEEWLLDPNAARRKK